MRNDTFKLLLKFTYTQFTQHDLFYENGLKHLQAIKLTYKCIVRNVLFKMYFFLHQILKINCRFNVMYVCTFKTKIL